jgi:hypothetical protein
VAEQQLDGAQVCAGFQQMDRKGVAQRVRGDRLGEAGQPLRLAAGDADGVAGDRLTGQVSREQPLPGMHGRPIGTQCLQQSRREHDVAVLAALALVDADDHAPAVDRVDCEVDGLGNAQAGGVAGGQDGVVLDVVDAAEEPHDLQGTEDDWQLLWLLRRRENLLEDPSLPERHLVEKAQCGDGDCDRR